MRKSSKFQLNLLVILLICGCGGGGGELQAAESRLAPDACEAPQGNRCWYVDADSADVGVGTFAKPYNSFEQVAGYMEGSSYRAGKIKGGDYLYVKGTFKASAHNETSNNTTIHLARGEQGGTVAKPTVIKSYNSTPRAVFDGEYKMSNFIRVRGFGEKPIAAIRIENIEVTRADSRGIWIGELVENCEVVNIRVTEGQGDGNNGTGGGILFSMQDSLHNFTIRNSYFSGNHRQRFGGPYNVGAVSILSEPSAKDGSIIRVFDNEFSDEDIAIRQKHSGNITMEAFNNRISSAKQAFHLRAKNNKVYRNLVTDSELLVYFDAGNQNSDIAAEFYNNTVIRTPIFVHTGTGNTDYRRELNFHDNIFSLPSGRYEGVLLLGRYSSTIYPLSQWRSSHNLFELGGKEREFLHNAGNKIPFDDALEMLGDTTSFLDEADFQDRENGDYRLEADSEQRTAGTAGASLGAL